MRRHSDLIAAILIGLAPFVYFLPATLGDIVLAEADALLYGMPLRIAIAEMLREGHLPLWNPYIFCGMPLFASAQAGILFPLNWSFLVLPPGLAMNLAVLSGYAGAGVGAFLYGRRTGANLLGASITAIVWQFSGFAIGHIDHTNMLHMYAVLPWIFWSIEGYLIRPSRRRGALVSLSVALGVFTGHPQTLAFGLVLACAYLCVRGMAEKETRWQTSLAAIGFLMVGLLLGAIQIVPTLELLQNSMREEATYEYFASYSLPPVFLLSGFAPYIVGGGDGTFFRAPYTGEPLYAEYCGYAAIAPLMLAAVAASLGRDWRTRFWMWAALACLLLALGRFLPFELYRVVYHVPILNLFRVPARHLMEVDFAVAILAGRAVTMLPAVRHSRRIFVSAGVVLVVVFFAWSAVTWLRPAIFRLGRPGPVTVLRAPELFLPVVLAVLSGWAVFRFAQGRRWSGAILLAVIAGDLALWGQFAGWRVDSLRPADDRFKTPQFVKEMREEIDRNGPFRIITLDRSLADALAQGPPTWGVNINLQPDVQMVHRIQNAAGYDGFGLKRYSRLAGDMKVAGDFPDASRSLLVSRELDLLNVRYLLAAPGHPTSTARWPERKRAENVVIYENRRALPRAWLASEARGVKGEAALEVIRTRKFPDGTEWDPLRTVLLDQSLEPDPISNPTTPGSIKIIRYEPNKVEIAAMTASPAVLVLADNYYPGWRVSINGNHAALLRVNYNLRGVRLAPGEHRVCFSYRPRSVLSGLVLSLLTATVLLFWSSRRSA